LLLHFILLGLPDRFDRLVFGVTDASRDCSDLLDTLIKKKLDLTLELFKDNVDLISLTSTNLFSSFLLGLSFTSLNLHVFD
jgi:hypothetical protein